MITTKQAVLEQSSAVRTPVLPEVLEHIKHIPVDYDGVVKYNTNIIEWLKPMIDLTGYYVYPRNGITEGLDWWYNRESRGVNMRSGDYQWINSKKGEGKIAYISLPSSIDGNMDIGPKLCPIALDLAYVGSTQVKPIELDTVEYAFYSLSKSFGVRNIRTGWIFTKEPDPKLEALTFSAKYYNYYAHQVAETIISNYDIDYVYNRVYGEQQRVCELLDVTPSDSVWLATSTHEDWSKFRRQDEIARICLAGVYEL